MIFPFYCSIICSCNKKLIIEYQTVIDNFISMFFIVVLIKSRFRISKDILITLEECKIKWNFKIFLKIFGVVIGSVKNCPLDPKIGFCLVYTPGLPCRYVLYDQIVVERIRSVQSSTLFLMIVIKISCVTLFVQFCNLLSISCLSVKLG